ncbi:MAG: S26 family signal peptidase, partial [Staphylococcus sp.]|nr:S26 family signal peptidase [Staphylococcus sp.]
MTKNEPHKMRNIDWYLNKILNLFLMVCGAALIWILLQVTCIATFKIPSDSMEPALLAGDNILVNKCVMGGRLFNV